MNEIKKYQAKIVDVEVGTGVVVVEPVEELPVGGRVEPEGAPVTVNGLQLLQVGVAIENSGIHTLNFTVSPGDFAVSGDTNPAP